MDDTIVCQLMCYRLAQAHGFVRHRNVNIVLMNQATPARRVSSITMKIRNVLVIVILLSEKNNNMLTMFGLPCRLLKSLANVFQCVLRKCQNSRPLMLIQCCEKE